MVWSFASAIADLLPELHSQFAFDLNLALPVADARFAPSSPVQRLGLILTCPSKRVAKPFSLYNSRLTMPPLAPAHTKLLICLWHPFTLWRPPADLAARIRRAFPGMNVVHLPTYDNLGDQITDADIFIGFSLQPNQFTAARKLKWIHVTAAGVSQLMYPEIRNSNVVITNASGVHSIPMAEHTLGLILSLARRFPASFRHQLQRKWAQQEIWDDPLHPRELLGQILLIVGFGAIGHELARRVRPLGMQIWAVTHSGKGDTSLADRIIPASQLRDVLPRADYVVLAAPETPETRRMIGAPEFAAMKPTAYLVNVARGTLVDEDAFYAALKHGSIAGAAIDVATEEPLPPSSPLWHLHNILITPHTSSVSESLWERHTALILENLGRWFSGHELVNLVDKAKSY